MNTPAANPWGAAGRTTKAAKLALTITREFGADAPRAARLASPAQWEAFALLADVLPPSEETQNEVRRLLSVGDRERQATALRRAIGA